ncbi:MAG: hypothetical protein N2259_00110 [Patescibacteria group bacterium]|nr:hypothetical protein [Patescibacteria group bacterium]
MKEKSSFSEEEMKKMGISDEWIEAKQEEAADLKRIQKDKKGRREWMKKYFFGKLGQLYRKKNFNPTDFNIAIILASKEFNFLEEIPPDQEIKGDFIQNFGLDKEKQKFFRYCGPPNQSSLEWQIFQKLKIYRKAAEEKLLHSAVLKDFLKK